MKKIINGILYNTETAKELAEWSNGLTSSDFSNETETLYRKKNGQLFLYGSGGPLSEYAVSYMQSWTSGEDIKPLTIEAAKRWAENKLDADEYEEVFGEVSEGDELVSVTLQFEHDVWKKLVKLASSEYTPAEDVIEEIVTKNFQ